MGFWGFGVSHPNPSFSTPLLHQNLTASFWDLKAAVTAKSIINFKTNLRMPKRRLLKKEFQPTIEEILETMNELIKKRAQDKGVLKALHWVPPMSKVALHLRTTLYHVRQAVIEHHQRQEAPPRKKLMPRPGDLWKSWGLSWSQIAKMI
jgi:hypothetical protein